MSVPSAPTNLRVTGISLTSVSYAWDPPTESGGKPITGYNLTIAPPPSNGIIFYTTDSLSLTVDGLVFGQTIYASIQASNDSYETYGEIAYFPTVILQESVPNPPATATAQRASNTSANISWTLPTFMPYPPIQWIVVESVSSNPSDPMRAISVDPFAGNGTVTDLNPLSTYTFKVYCVSTLDYSSPTLTNSIVLFQPNFVPGCVMWLDASDSSTILQTDQGTVSTWLDKSGASQNAIGHGQTYTGSSVQFINNSMTINCPSQPQQTVVLVAKPSSTQATKYLYDQDNGSSVPSIIANYTESWVEYFNGTDRATFTTAPTPCFMTAFAYDQGQTVRGYYNSDQPVFNIPQTQINVFPVAYSRLGSDQSIDAQLCEVILYNQLLSNDDWQTLVAYLKQKWSF